MDIIVVLALLIVGYGTGRYAELRHYKSIIRREQEYHDILAIASKHLPDGVRGDTRLVVGSVVISVDFFKRFVAGLRSLVGGRVTSYELLLDRTRREAVLRMKREVRAFDAKMIFNIKYETASISKGRKNAVGSVEVLAYGTALRTI